jgi:hypothetical protein
MAEPAKPRGRRRWLELAFNVAALAVAAWCIWGVWHNRRLAERFPQVALGMDRAAVEALLGAPDWEGACGGYVPSLPRADCAREIGYTSAFAPLVSTYYPIQLDRRGRVIEADAISAR